MKGMVQITPDFEKSVQFSGKSYFIPIEFDNQRFDFTEKKSAVTWHQCTDKKSFRSEETDWVM